MRRFTAPSQRRHEAHARYRDISILHTLFCVLAIAIGCWVAPALSQTIGSSAATANAVFVEVQADGQQCIVGKATLACSDVLDHLRQVLKLPPGTWIRFKAGRAAPYRAVKQLIEEIQRSEYATSMAYLPPPKQESPQP